MKSIRSSICTPERDSAVRACLPCVSACSRSQPQPQPQRVRDFDHFHPCSIPIVCVAAVNFPKSTTCLLTTLYFTSPATGPVIDIHQNGAWRSHYAPLRTRIPAADLHYPPSILHPSLSASSADCSPRCFGILDRNSPSLLLVLSITLVLSSSRLSPAMPSLA
jgi:hypothetical protein